MTQPSSKMPDPPKYFPVQFFIDEVIIVTQATYNMTISQLIKNFRVKLCNNNIKIDKYIMHPSNIELDPYSNETLCSKGIDENVRIIAKHK